MKMKPIQEDLKTIAQHLIALSERYFYGEVTIQFQRGKVVLLRQSETMKPQSINQRNNRKDTIENDNC